MTSSAAPLFESHLESLQLLTRGKVRDIYLVDRDRLLIVASDRISAFDVILPNPIPRKGIVLTAISNMWFRRLGHIVPNHLTGVDPATVVAPNESDTIRERAVVVERLKPLPIEAVVRGYLIGSGWKDYCATGQVSGVKLPRGMEMSERLREPIFTPSTKAPQGAHDENIDFSQTEQLLGAELAARVRHASLELYGGAVEHAARAGIIIADTKFEFGLTEHGELKLIDELLTPDSSRFWPADSYRPGASPPSYDKQYVRDYLETIAWNKAPPAPTLPAMIVERTSAKYLEALERLTSIE